MGKPKKKKDSFAKREAEKYENPIPSREFIIEYLAEKGQPATHKHLISELALDTAEEQEALRRRLIAMVRDGQLHRNQRGAYGPVGKMELIAGRVIGHKDGFGFIVPDAGGDDLFVSAREMRKVFHGDKVLAHVSGTDHRGRSEAAIVEVTERNTRQLVGRFQVESGITFVEPSNQRIPQDILITPDATGGANPGQMVVVAITEQPSSHIRPAGNIIEILGDHMAPGMEIDVALRNHDLPYIWSDEVLKEAAQYEPTVPKASLAGRVDFRDLPFVTIDGEDARDFDDAVYCTKHKNGWILYVAIADVSHYVKVNSALDKEALARGNSVYFPGQVIPMLPEELSNELCSLKPNVDRLTMTCEMTVDKTGTITNYKFHESVIKSHARLTYNQVYAMIEEKNAPPHIKELFDLYSVLHKTRIARGSIDFDLPETKIIFGPDRKIERIVATERNTAHRLIEECMLCANICAALFLIEKERPGLFRVHEGPRDTKLDDLRKFLNELGLKLPGRKIPTPRDYAEILKSIANRPDAHLIQTVLLRSLSQAVYSPENKGHFGLAYDAYTHFTSPIRRYPDLLVHRAIRGIITPNLESQGEHCSMTERRADDATREVMDWLKCEYMMDKVGEDFAGVVTSVTSFGLFIELSEIYVEGLLHISALSNDYYHFDPIKHVLSGEHSGTQYRLGDPIKIKVARVDLDERKIDFVLTEELKNSRPPKKKKREKR